MKVEIRYISETKDLNSPADLAYNKVMALAKEIREKSGLTGPQLRELAARIDGRCC